ncbi:MAG: DUF58 domain-containing protein [Nitrospirae bacterium]|nr:MAG: DUF58 domain-containing protein [Nitrospirota bacterium]
MERFLTKRNALIFLSGLFLLIAWNREINLLYGMFSLISATLIIALILPRYSVRHLSGQREIPSVAVEGDELPVKVQIDNRAGRSRYMLEVKDLFPAAEKGLRSPMTFIGRLRSKERKTYSYTVSCYKRGEYSVGPLKISSAYPLGIASSEMVLQAEPVPLLVYPKVFEIARLPFLRGSSAYSSMADSAVRTGGSEDFFGTREYREGDSLRYIHWPSSARHGHLIVKEFETRATAMVTAILDLQKGSEAGEGRETTLEYSVTIAASLARYILGKGHSFQLAGYGKEKQLIPYGRGPAQLAKALGALARAKADGGLPYRSAIERAAEMLRDGDMVVLFFCHGDETPDNYAYCLGLLKARRIRPVAVFMDRTSFTDTAGTLVRHSRLEEEFRAMNAIVYNVSRGCDLEAVFGV